MGRLVIVLDPDAGVSPRDLAAEWDADEETRSIGTANVEAAAPGSYLPDVLTLVAIPVAVNLASAALTAVVGRLVTRLRKARTEQSAIELIELTSANGDRVVVVRLRRERP